MLKNKTKEKESVVNRIKKTPFRLSRLIAVACAAAVIGTGVPVLTMNASAQNDIYANTTAYLNLRKGAGMDYSVIKVMNKGTKLTVVDRSDSTWIKVKLSDGTVGYCSSRYLDIITDAQASDYLNMRKGAGTNYGVIKTLSPGTKLDIIKFCGNKWAQVQLTDGTKGYVCTDYVTYISNTVTKTTANNTQTQTSSVTTAVRTAAGSSADKVTISHSSATIGIGQNVTLTAKTSSGGTITWSSSNKNIATVTSKGVVTGVKEGAITITAKDSKTGKSADCTIRVKKNTIKSIKIPSSSQTLYIGETYTIKPTVTPTDGKVEYYSADTGIATVSGAGTVKAVKAGTVKITVYDPIGTAKAVLNVTVKNIPKLTLSASTANIYLGANTTLKATISDGSSIKWTSSDNNVASVRGGIVSGLKAGTATITASDKNGKVKVSCRVNVMDLSSYGVSLSRYSASTTAGKTIYIKGYSNYYAGWGTSDSNIATVRDGFICTKNPGKVAITYTDGYSRRAVCVVTVYDADPIRFTYSSPNSAVLNSTVKLIAITDKTRTNVKFEVNENGKTVTVNASEKMAEGNTYVWTGYYKTTVAGTLPYKAYSYKNNTWSTSADGTADVYVTSKTDHKTTGLEKLRASDEVIKMIGDKEGFVSGVTYDTLANNIPTLGHGYVVWEGDRFYDNLTRSEGFALLVKAINTEVYTTKVNQMLIDNNIRFNQQQFDALVSYSYNLGTGWTVSSDLKNILLNSYGPVSDGSTVYGYVDAVGGLNLRESYTTSSKVITVLGDGERVTLISTQKYNGVWYKVKTSSGKVGYCSGTYLNLSGSTTGRDLNYVNKNALIKDVLAYHHAGGKCYYGLLYRRCDELEMFLYGDYEDDGHMNYHNFPSPYCLSF